MALNNRESGYFFAKRKSRENRNRLVAILGCMVVLATAIALMMPALSMTHGDAVCGVEEHAHTDACYERVLVCGLDESNGHEHSDACYETKLTCEKPEHEHSSACFVGGAGEGGEADGANGAAEATAGADADAVNGDAGKADAAGDAEGNASQGASSAASSVSAASADAADGDSASQGDSANSEGKDGAATAKLNTQSANMPAQEFKADLKDENDDVVLTVAVKAPKGAFPENTHMKIDGVPMEDVQEQVEATLKDAGLDSPELKQAQAVDIAFFSEDGDVIQPAKAVAVKIAAQSLQDVESPVLMRVLESDQVVKLVDGSVADRNGEPFANAADKYAGAKVVKKVEKLEADAKDAEGGMVTLAFKADEFSPFTLLELDEESADQVAAALADEGEDEEASDSSDSDGDGDDDGADGSAKSEGAAGAGKVIKSEVAMPAQKFSENVKGEDGKTALSVAVEAPEGALPDGASMVVQLVEDNDVTAAAKEKAEGESAVSGTHAQVVAADITFLDAEGNAVEPAKDVRVTMGAPVVASSNEVAVVHVDDKLDAEVVKASEVDQKNETVAFEAGSFSVYAIVYTVGSEFSANGELYEVTVTYGEDAKIPEGSTLKVTEFSEDDAEYEYARNSVLADKKAKGEKVDLKSFGLAALDISILNPNGEEIEPAAPVQVDIRIKELPGVEDLDDVASTLAIQHHVEVKDGVVVETVYDGNAEGSFKLETNETVTKEGDAVDPGSVSEEDFADPEITILEDADAPQSKYISKSFEVTAFSTFTLTWMKDRGSDNSTVNLMWRGNGWNPPTYSKITIRYLDIAGNPITAPVGNQTVTNPQTISITSGNYTDIPGYQFDHAFVWYDQSEGTGWNLDEVSVRFLQDYYGQRYTLIQHGGENYKGGAYSSNQPYRDEIILYFKKVDTERLTATVHYVDEAGNELPVSNGQPVSDTYDQIISWYWSEEDQDYTIPAERWYFNSLIYDVDGYEYAYTYRNANTAENHITPILNYRNDSWKYTSGTEAYGPSNTWANLSDQDDIYVVYKPKATVTQGGTPQPKITGDKPDVPTITKGSVVNNDGTNTLSLSVTGHTSVMEAEKLADVIVVYDVSGSMNFEMGSETEADFGERRMDYAQEATEALANSLLGKNTAEHPDLIRMSLISFSNAAEKRQDFTTDLTAFNNAVANLPAPDGGTNWEDALQMANEMAVESDRATFVVFVTDGNPTFRQTRGVLNNGGEGGLGDEDVSGYYLNYSVYGTGYSDIHNRNYAAALSQAQSIVEHDKNFYTIGISNDVTNLTKLTTEAGAGADHSKTATSNDELVAAFNDIAASIIAHLGHSDVQITDGITDLTQTVQKSTLVNFAEDDFVYSKERLATQEEISDSSKVPEGAIIENRDGTKYVVWNNWDPTSEGCAKAIYDTKTGAVKWNMGEGFMLEDGYTYRVKFKVWPSQEAYDLLADLNNGKKSYSELTDAEKAQIKEPTTAGGVYTLKTNSETSYTYREATKSGDTVTPTGEPSEPGSFPDVDPLELTTKPLKVKKQWHYNYSASRTPVDQITMELYGVDSDGTTSHDFKAFTLTKDNDWYAENNYVSYGLVTYDTETDSHEKVYETGHDFTLRETDDEAHYFELTAGVYRPMYINGTPTILERVDTAPERMGDAFHYTDGTHHYYRLDGKIYRDTQSDTLLLATNTRRSYMDLNKVVVDDSGAQAVDDTEFEYKITFTVPRGIANYDTLEKYIWFSVYDSVAQRTLAPSEYTHAGTITPAQEDPEAFSGPQYANYLVAISGQQVTLKIKQGWNVRFLNLPIGTTYSFEETSIPEDYNFVKAEVSGTRWIANMVDGKDQGSAQDMTSLPSNASGNNSNTGISGTIDFANAQYSTTYTNKAKSQHVKILKTSQDSTTPLQGAAFSLYTDSGYNADPKVAVKTGLTSDENGAIDLDELAYGKYYLVETSAPEGYVLLSAPVEITVAASGVTYKQEDYSQSISGDGFDYDETTNTYTLTVTNNAGYELPSTGGSGTAPLYALGSLCVLVAATCLLRRRFAK